MPIQVTCPHCLSIFNLRDELEGKTVRCKKCANTFAARAAGKAKPADDEGPARRKDSVRTTPGGATRARALPDDDDERPRRRRPAAYDDDDEDDLPVPPLKKGSVLPWVLGGVGAALLVVLLMCGGLVYLVFHAAGNAINDVVADAQDMDQPGANPVQNLGPPPMNLDQALADLRGGNAGRRRVALLWMTQLNPDDARRTEVVQAVEPLLTGQEPFLGDDAAKVFARWSTREQVPTLLRLLESQSGGTRTAALEALGRLKDERAARPLAARLPNFFDRQGAGKALEALGPAAEKEVVKYAFHRDGGCRDEARRLLRVYGTKDSELLSQALAALKDPERDARKGAVEWLLTAPMEPQRAAEVVQALEPLLNDSDHFTREPAGKALCRWANKDNVPALLKCLDHQSHEVRKAAATALGNLKDERAAPALARQLAHEARDYGPALEALGPAAAEKEVVKYFFDQNHGAQEEARRILRVFGTKPEVILDQAVVELKEAGADEHRQEAVCTWLGQAPVEEKRRADVALALDPLVKGGKNRVKEFALKALLVWATKENVPMLISVVEDQGFGNNTPRQLAIQALGKLKDDRAAVVVTISLTNFFDREIAASALEAMGPGAEKPVKTGLGNKDAQVRMLVCRILKMIGTKESLKELELHAKGDQDLGVRQAAALAYAAIKARQ